MIKKSILTVAITTLLLLASIGGYFVFTGWLSLYDYGRVVLAVGVIASIFGFLTLAAKSTPLPLVKGQEGLIPHRPSWVDNMPAVTLGCILGIVAGYMIMDASISLGLRPARSQSIPYVLSLRANLPTLEKKALSWQDDAYLADATIYLKDNDLSSISAHFKSPSISDQSLVVDVTPNDSIKLHPIDWKITVPQEEPIQDGDWSLDSKAALETFAQNDAIRFCLNSSGEHRKHLTLERLRVGEERPLVWTLFVDACPRSSKRKHHIDAVTGEFVDFEPIVLGKDP